MRGFCARGPRKQQKADNNPPSTLTALRDEVQMDSLGGQVQAVDFKSRGDGLEAWSDEAEASTDGLDGVSNSIKEVSDGLKRSPDGLKRLSDGIKKVSDGIGALIVGVGIPVRCA